MISPQGRNLAVALLAGLAFSLASWEVVVYGNPLPVYLIQYNLAVYSGAAWQLLTSVFVVIPFSAEGPLGVVDVLFNAMALVWLDGLLSHSFREWDYYAVFFLSAIAGNLASLLNGPDAASFGASGGIFGLLAGAVAREFATERRVNYSLLAWFLAVFIFSSFALSYVDWQAHLGGAAAGLAMGYLLAGARGGEDL
jgi:rhomboid protease GluP